MPFLGTTPTQGFVSSFPKQSFTPNGSTTVFTLTNPVATANDLEVFVGNVRQEPTTAYTAAGTTLTMSEAPASGLNFYVINKSFAQVTTTPPDGSVSTDKIISGAVTNAKLASGAAVANIGTGAIATAKLADDAITTAKMNASLITHIDAGSSKAQGVTGSFADTNLSGNITIPAGCTSIIWHMRGGTRQNGIGVDHTSYRLKFVRSGDNRTTYIGGSSWGLGISQMVGANTGSNTSNHSIIHLYASLFDYDTAGNQAQLAVGDTYAVTIQVKSSGANGSNLYTFGDTSNNAAYYPAHMTFMFF